MSTNPSVREFMHTCVEQGASDIHLSVGVEPMLRKHTHLIRMDVPPLTGEDVEHYMHEITPERIRNEYTATGSGDFSYQYGSTRFRCAIYRERGNCALALRRISDQILTIEQIGLPQAVKELCGSKGGLFLVTGPTGSGKTTTLTTLIDYINVNFKRHIVTFEDPIEFYHSHKRSLVHQREVSVGNDVPTFIEGLRRVLRQDPDIILIGEMRDLETIRAAITAAETGHFVFATVHTSGAGPTFSRIIQAFPVNEQEHIRVQVAGSALAVISQALCPRIDTEGVVAAYEFLQVTPAVRAMIRDNRPFSIDSAIQTGKNLGMQLLDDHLFELVRNQVIHPDIAIENARDAKHLAEKLAALN